MPSRHALCFLTSKLSDRLAQARCTKTSDAKASVQTLPPIYKLPTYIERVLWFGKNRNTTVIYKQDFKSFLNKEVEQEIHKKGLSLDTVRIPRRNFHLNQNQNQVVTNTTYVEQGEGGDEEPLEPPSPKKRLFLNSSASLEASAEHERLQRKMEENTRSQQIPSRVGLRNRTGGDIGEVQGCHIVRSTGRKDRHSKVCTSKGPRDRRVRLAAHTAIQFYDLQDRLGCDRPSKVMDWLIKKAKPAIDELEQLPASNPTIFSAENAIFEQEQARVVDPNIAGSSSKMAMTMSENENGLQVLHRSSNADPNASFLPPSLDSDTIADTIKSCFPIGTSRTRSQSQDLRLSLQSFQDPLMLHHQQPRPPHHKNHTHNTEAAYSQHQVPVNGTTLLGFDGCYAGWSEHHQHQPKEISRFQGLAPWNTGGDISGGNGGAAGYLFTSQPAPQPVLQRLLGQSQFFSHGGPLQSSNTPSIRAWIDQSTIPNTTADHSHQHHHNPAAVPIYPSSISGVEFTSTVGGFSGFHIPARIQAGIALFFPNRYYYNGLNFRDVICLSYKRILENASIHCHR
ncbi:unnamed protein product [Fraxinus pennsylvanica]|uniref:TCP domain-containing protein n=1 Tax=Fraxinus pennsylvanica TaxID=56036 RepID=A0AAD2EGX5_9LAMI|nr:unnamed protein product [Fraxinus pennsylvanica]